MAQWGVTEAKVGSHRVVLVQARILLACALTPFSVRADEPKPTPENTIHVQLAAPVAPQKFAKPPKFFISEVIDRSGNPQPMLVLKDRGGMFLDRLPTQITREAIEESLKAADLLAAGADPADLGVPIYVFHFCLAQGSGLHFFRKVEFFGGVKNPQKKESQEKQTVG